MGLVMLLCFDQNDHDHRDHYVILIIQVKLFKINNLI